MPIATKESLTAICRMDGVIVAASPALTSFAESANQNGGSFTTLTELTNLIDGDGLTQRVEAFAASEDWTETFSQRIKSGEALVSLQKLGQKVDAPQRSSMILVNLILKDASDHEKDLLRAGRMTSQLAHDLKNQIGGIKLYAAYLKKRFADSPEGLEIAEKIVLGLNAMAELVGLMSKLTRPLELNRRPVELVSLLKQTINDHQARAEARNVGIDSDLGEEAIHSSVDAQQLRGAIGAVIARAIDSSVAGDRVLIRLRRGAGELSLEVVDHGPALSDQHLQNLFDLPSGEKINQISLNLAIARRIIERHGGETTAFNSPQGATIVQVKIPNREGCP